MPDTLRIGLLGPLQVRDGTGQAVHVGGRQLRVLLILLALEAGRVVPTGSLAGQIWPEESPANPGNALQTLVSRLRAELRRASLDQVIESHPAGYRLAVRPDAVDALDFQVLAGRGRRALAEGDPREAAAVLRSALASWRGQPLADAAGYDFADAAAAQLTELRSSVLADRIEPDRRCAARRSRTRSPAPPSGRSSVARIRTAVVLPAPLGPRTPSTRPFRATRSTPASAVVLPNRLTRPVASTAFADGASYRMNPPWAMPLSERAHPPVSPAPGLTASCPGPARSGRNGSRRRQSRWRELPNMISSQDGTEDRRPRAALRFWRPVCSAPASACAAASPFAAGGSAAGSTAGGGAA
jgi:DNA-binding winged helix-turn-helix (wHTH) protein